MMYLAVALNDRSSDIISEIISLATWSKAYHVELIFYDGVAAIADISGVRLESRKEYDTYKWKLVALPFISESKERKIRGKAECMIAANPKYDLKGAIFGKWFNNLDKDDCWFCSELCADLLSEVMPELYTDKWLSPGDVWKIVADHISLVYPEIISTDYLVKRDE